VLVGNYDYPVSRLEGIVSLTGRGDRQVIGMSDCLWGLLDGMNDAGLAISLTFGGRRDVGDGFAISLALRLEPPLHNTEFFTDRPYPA
jgi:predicted choloylglycine hydrolase